MVHCVANLQLESSGCPPSVLHVPSEVAVHIYWSVPPCFIGPSIIYAGVCMFECVCVCILRRYRFSDGILNKLTGVIAPISHTYTPFQNDLTIHCEHLDVGPHLHNIHGHT